MRFLIFIIIITLGLSSNSLAQDAYKKAIVNELPPIYAPTNPTFLGTNNNTPPKNLPDGENRKSLVTNAPDIKILPPDNMPCLTLKGKSNMPVISGLALHDFMPEKIPNSIAITSPVINQKPAATGSF